MNCIYCNKEVLSQQSKIQHELRCKQNPHKIEVKPSYGMLGKKGSNQYIKGTAKPLSDESRYKIGKSGRGRVWTDEMKQQHSISMKRAVLANPESYSSSNRGRTKQIIIDGINLQGKWEVAFYLWAKGQGLNPIKPTEGFPYEWNGTRSYYPDFYIKSLDLYIEVKGYETERDRAKWLHFPKKLRIIKACEIKQIRNNTFAGL